MAGTSEMKRWQRYAVSTLEVAAVLSVAYFEPTHSVRGTLRGEAFYNGKPTSWWRHELDCWDVSSVLLTNQLAGVDGRLIFYERKLTWFEQQRERWISGRSGKVKINHLLVGPKILSGGGDAEPVLRSLVDDPSPRVRRMARIGLGMNSDLDGE